MKHVRLFEQFLNEAARLRSKRDWKKDIADELGADGDEIIDDLDDGYFKATYDGYTGFDIEVFDNNDNLVDSDFVDCDGMGSSEIEDAIWSAARDMA